MSAKIVPISGKTHKVTRTRSDTWLLTRTLIDGWKSPSFQRPLRINEKVRQLIEELKLNGGVVPGIIVLGELEGKHGKDTYLIDGQHRIEAWLMSELPDGYADVRIHQFDDMGEMGEEFVRLNTKLVSMRPDDILRGLEESLPSLHYLRQKCPFVAYDQVRRGDRSPVLSMSAFLRCWFGSTSDTPTTGGTSAYNLAKQFTIEEADKATSVLHAFEKAWGRDPEYWRLWSNLNLTLCLWLYRRTVLEQFSTRSTKMTKDIFTKTMMALSADNHYLDWLQGRLLSDRDRSPAYARMCISIARRFLSETGVKAILPKPPWSKSK